MAAVLPIGSRVEWLDEGVHRLGAITQVITTGRFLVSAGSRELSATPECPLYLVETESGARRLVPHMFVSRLQ